MKATADAGDRAARLGDTFALFTMLVQWAGFPVDADGNVHRSIAQFSV
jgi:hypothetical protein